LFPADVRKVRRLLQDQGVGGKRTFWAVGTRCSFRCAFNNFDPSNLGSFILQSFLLVLR